MRLLAAVSVAGGAAYGWHETGTGAGALTGAAVVVGAWLFMLVLVWVANAPGGRR